MIRHDNAFLDPNAIDNHQTETEIAAIFKENLAKGIVVSETMAADIAVDGLKDAIDTSIEERRLEPTGSIFQQLEELLPVESEALPEFEKAYTESQTLFERIGSEIPSPADFDAAGVDFSGLAEEWESMKNQGLEPQLVIAPTYGSPVPWKNLYKKLAQAELIGPNLSNQGGPDDVLQIMSEVEEYWHILDKVPVAFGPSLTSGIVGKNDLNGHQSSEVIWTVRLVSATNKSGFAGFPYHIPDAEPPTLGEYLSMQAVRAQSSMALVDYETTDKRSLTWLHGTYVDEWEFAPTAGYGKDKGMIWISSTTVDDSAFLTLGHRVARSKLK